MPADKAARRLRSLDVCTVSDALDRLQMKGAVSGIRPVWEGARTAGRVVTMSVGAADGRRPERHLGTKAIEMAEAGDVIVIERRDENPPEGSSWGGLLARAAVQREVAGVVIDGGCRDVDEVRELGLCVSARGVVPFTARNRLVELSVGEEIAIAGVPVAPGDYVIADGSGVAFIRAAEVERVLAEAEEIARREALMAKRLASGDPPSKVMGRTYEELINGTR